MNWTAGCHTVDGNTALAFSRMRYADVQGDFGRAARQRQVINAIVKKGASKQTLTNFNKTKKVAAAALQLRNRGWRKHRLPLCFGWRWLSKAPQARMAFREACIGPIRTITSMGSDRAFC